MKSIVAFLGILVVGILLTLSSCTSVDTGKIGVPVTFGKVSDTVLPSGIHFVNPAASVTELDIRTRNYTMSAVSREGNKDGDDAVDVISKDQLKVGLDVTILYRMKAEAGPNILRTLAGNIDDQIVRPQIRSALRDKASNYSAVELMGDQKNAFVAEVTTALNTSFNNYGVVLEQVLLRGVQLPQAITNAINEKVAAEQESQKMKFLLAREQQEAERKRVQAKGEADYNAINAEKLTPAILEARRIDAFTKLAQSGNLVIVPAGNQMLFNMPTKK